MPRPSTLPARQRARRPATIDVIGFHGQTVLHRPERTAHRADSATAQRWRSRLGIPVVYDLRAADVAAGGQGAPLVPVYHRALAGHGCRAAGRGRSTSAASPTSRWIGRDGGLLAFDTGPGNALIDDWMQRARPASTRDDGGAGRARPRRRDACRLSAEPPVLRRAAAEIPRPQCFSH